MSRESRIWWSWPLSWYPDFLHPGESGFHGHYDRYMHAPTSGKEGYLVNGQIGQELLPCIPDRSQQETGMKMQAK